MEPSEEARKYRKELQDEQSIRGDVDPSVVTEDLSRAPLPTRLNTLAARHEFDSSNLDRMAMYQELARDFDSHGYQYVADQAEHNLAEVAEAKQALEGSHPRFSDVIDEWIETDIEDLESRGVTIDALEVGSAYQRLYIEMEDDYREFINRDDTDAIQAQAEWDVIRDIISERIDEQVVRWTRSIALEKLGYKQEYAQAA